MTVFGMVINFCRHWRLYLCWACWVHSFYQVSNRVFLVFCFTLKIQRIKWLYSIKTQYAIREVRGEYYLAELFVVFTLGESLIKKGVKLKKNGKMRNSAKNTKIRITKIETQLLGGETAEFSVFSFECVFGSYLFDFDMNWSR